MEKSLKKINSFKMGYPIDPGSKGWGTPSFMCMNSFKMGYPIDPGSKGWGTPSFMCMQLFSSFSHFAFLAV